MGVHLVSALERLAKHSRISIKVTQMPEFTKSDIVLGFMLILFVCVPAGCCCCHTYAYFGSQGFWSKFHLYDRSHENRGAMQPGHWMVLIEEGVRNVKFFAFDDPAIAQKFFNACAPFLARILFQPLPDGGHIEYRVAGANRVARDQIRTWSQIPAVGMVPGMYNVVIYKKRALFYPFAQEHVARAFMCSFEWLVAIMYDPQGHEQDTSKTFSCGLMQIRSAVNRVSIPQELRVDGDDPLVQNTRSVRSLSYSSLDGTTRPYPRWDTTSPGEEADDPPTPGCDGTLI